MNDKALKQLGAFATRQSQRLFTEAKQAKKVSTCAHLTRQGVSWLKVSQRATKRLKPLPVALVNG